MTVHLNRCLDKITAGGVQISGLHATVAPRRQQQQQNPPTLEEFLFVRYVETECLANDGKLGEQLKLCKGTPLKTFLVLYNMALHREVVFFFLHFYVQSQCCKFIVD